MPAVARIFDGSSRTRALLTSLIAGSLCGLHGVRPLRLVPHPSGKPGCLTRTASLVLAARVSGPKKHPAGA